MKLKQYSSIGLAFVAAAGLLFAGCSTKTKVEGNTPASIETSGGGATHATTHSWRLLRSAEEVENSDLTAAYCTLEVVQNLSEFVGTGT